MALGCRGAVNFDLIVELREGGHHSGNWGADRKSRLAAAHALASIAEAVRAAIADIEIDVGPQGELLVEELKAPPMSARSAAPRRLQP
jgi:hypothetical protein